MISDSEQLLSYPFKLFWALFHLCFLGFFFFFLIACCVTWNRTMTHKLILESWWGNCIAKNNPHPQYPTSKSSYVTFKLNSKIVSNFHVNFKTVKFISTSRSHRLWIIQHLFNNYCLKKSSQVLVKTRALLQKPFTICDPASKKKKSRIAKFCVMAKNRWSGSACVIFRFWYLLKEQSFFCIILKFGSIKRIISRGFCCFSRPIFLWSDQGGTVPPWSDIHVVAIRACVLSFPYKLDYLAYFEPLQLLKLAS